MKDENIEGTAVSAKRRPRWGGGPHGFGDPDDLSLRKVELEVLIPKKIRDRTRNEKCVEAVAEFSKCCRESNVFMVFTCRKENSKLKACLEEWYNNEDFKKECKEEYLKERSDYRKTGISAKAKSTRLPTN